MNTRKNNTTILVCLSAALLSAGCMVPDASMLGRSAMVPSPEQRIQELQARQAKVQQEIESAQAAAQKEIRDQEVRAQEQKMAERKAREENAERSRAWKSESKSVSLSDSVSIELQSIPGPLWVGKFEVTQAQWEAVMGANPSLFKGADNPVESITWDDCQKFLKALNALPGVKASGLTFRLPTEEEWCLARYAGATGKYGTFADGTEITKNDLDKVAWLKETSDDETHPVGQKEPNAFGLYDMIGNVEELTSTTDTGYKQMRLRVTRGGCFGNLTAGLLDFDRSTYPEDIGIQQKAIGLRLVATESGN